MKNQIRKAAFLLLLVLTTLVFFGCKSEESGKNYAEVYDSAEQVYCNVNASGFSINIALLTKTKVQSVSLISCAGKNLDMNSIKVTCADNSIDIYRDFQYKGYYCSNWMFEFLLYDIRDIEIETMTISVDGAKRVLQFKTPVKCSNNTGYGSVFNDELCAHVFPVEFSSYELNGENEFEYRFEAETECVFKGLSVAGGVKIINPVFSVNDVSVEPGEEGIPLKAGDQLSVRMSYQGEEADVFSYCVTDLVVSYSVDGVLKQGCFCQCFSPLSPMDGELNNLKRYIDYRLNEVTK